MRVTRRVCSLLMLLVHQGVSRHPGLITDSPVEKEKLHYNWGMLINTLVDMLPIAYLIGPRLERDLKVLRKGKIHRWDFWDYFIERMKMREQQACMEALWLIRKLQERVNVRSSHYATVIVKHTLLGQGFA